MRIKKYKAKITNSETEVVGYITETREYLGAGTYGDGTDYLINVTEKSMPKGNYGIFKVDSESISEFKECPVCRTKELSPDTNYLACSEACYKKL